MNGAHRKILLAVVTCLACGALATPVQASFHLNKIREVSLGNGGMLRQDAYVELQAYAPGQNLLGTHTLTTYAPNGGVNGTCTFPGPVAKTSNQMTVLISGPAYSGPSDLTCSLNISGVGGAVCWGTDQPVPLDCMSYGSFTGSIGSPTGSPASEPPDGTVLRRSIAAGCATLLESGDDTDNSTADFALAAPSPRNNASPITETPCVATGAPNTKIKKRPKNRSDDDSPTFKFKSTEAGSIFKCKLDHKKFHKCKSPKTFHGLDPGKHTFKVEAIDADGNADATPAKDKFKILP